MADPEPCYFYVRQGSVWLGWVQNRPRTTPPTRVVVDTPALAASFGPVGESNRASRRTQVTVGIKGAALGTVVAATFGPTHT